MKPEQPISATPAASESSVPSEGREYVLQAREVQCPIEPLKPEHGGLLAIGELRGQKVVSREAIDAKSGKKIVRHRLVINLESLDGAGTPLAIEFNGWENKPSLLPFQKGDRLIARVTGEFNGSYSIDAVGRL